MPTRQRSLAGCTGSDTKSQDLSNEWMPTHSHVLPSWAIMSMDVRHFTTYVSLPMFSLWIYKMWENDIRPLVQWYPRHCYVHTPLKKSQNFIVWGIFLYLNIIYLTKFYPLITPSYTYMEASKNFKYFLARTLGWKGEWSMYYTMYSCVCLCACVYTHMYSESSPSFLRKRYRSKAGTVVPSEDADIAREVLLRSPSYSA